MVKYQGLKMMIESDFFTIEMLLQYLIKYHTEKPVIKMLVDRLRTFNKNVIYIYIIEIIYYTLCYECKEIDIFLLDLCSESFESYAIITTNFETWGF